VKRVPLVANLVDVSSGSEEELTPLERRWWHASRSPSPARGLVRLGTTDIPVIEGLLLSTFISPFYARAKFLFT
jgi:hypothetical protein